jgi:glutamyl-tRNA(Gln) amidotransferase subunit D
MNMRTELSGYKGKVLKFLMNADLQIGDIVQIIMKEEVFEGTLMPRYELADDNHIVLKLKNGYNIGIKINQGMVIKKVGTGTKPNFTIPSQPKESMELPTVAIISTGGTIASRVDYRTGAVHPALTSDDILTVVPELSEIANIKTKVLFSLLSENIHASHWTQLAQVVAQHVLMGVDGVVICHGTDTMAYTSAALSFALQNLPVPVILVGSQRSSDRPSSDAALNLINAVKAAARAPIAEVMVGMHETASDTITVLHRGTRVRKCHTSRRDAFKSINIRPLARIKGEELTLLEDYRQRDPNNALITNPTFEEKVALLKFYPGLNPQTIDWYMDNGYCGLILEGTGLGHIGDYLFPQVRKAVEQGLILGMASQCIWGRVNMNVYDTGMDLQRMGVIPLKDMLPETALVKMMWSFGQTTDPEEVKRLLLSNIAGEFSERTLYEQ